MKKRVSVLFAQQEAFPHSEVLLSSCLTGSKTSVFSGVTNAQSMWMSVSVTVSIAHCYTHNVFLPAMPKHFRHHWLASNAPAFVCPFFVLEKRKNKGIVFFVFVACQAINKAKVSKTKELEVERGHNGWTKQEWEKFLGQKVKICAFVSESIVCEATLRKKILSSIFAYQGISVFRLQQFLAIPISSRSLRSINCICDKVKMWHAWLGAWAKNRMFLWMPFVGHVLQNMVDRCNQQTRVKSI